MDDVLSDAEILARLTEEDPAMFRLLVDRYSRRLFAYAWRYTACEADAEEIVQETLLRVYRGAANYDPARPFVPWLFTIIANLCHNWHKRRPAATVSLDREFGDNGRTMHDSLRGREKTPEAEALDAETAREVREALDALPAAHKSVFLLYYYEDFSLQEIAAALGIPVGTVKSRLHNGGKRLADILERRLNA